MHADNAQALINKLQELPPERQIEVEDFIDFRDYGVSDAEIYRANRAHKLGTPPGCL